MNNITGLELSPLMVIHCSIPFIKTKLSSATCFLVMELLEIFLITVGIEGLAKSGADNNKGMRIKFRKLKSFFIAIFI
jgi:hypothetical protein